MAGITSDVVEEIKARTELSDLVASYGVQIHSAGSSKKACCPFHNEKTPSFHINDRQGYFHCFGCGEKGDALTFVMKMEGLTFAEAAKKLAARCGVKIEEKADPDAGRRKRLYALMAELAQFYHRCLLQIKEAEVARAYLKSRDLGDDVQERFLIGYAPVGVAPLLKWAEKHGYALDDLVAAGVVKPPDAPGDMGYHRFGGRLMFTICDKQGRAVAFSGRQLVENKRSGKYVNSPETPIFKKSNVLFGFDKAAANIAKSPHREVLVCEGQIDTIRLHACGFPIAVASQGTAFTEEHVRMVKNVADQVVLVFDDDAAGHKATIRTAGLFLAASMPVRTVSLPSGDDPDSFLRTHPKEEFQAMLDNAASIMAFQVRTERAKEKDATTIDAVNRIVRAVLTTIAQSPNAVLRASMVGEAAKLLGLPSAALTEELAKVKTEPVRARRPPAPAAPEMAPDEEPPPDMPPAEAGDEPAPVQQSASEAEPPPPLEVEFASFLLAHENSEFSSELDALLGELLPPQVFAHDFTRRFVETWRTELVQGADLIGPWSATLAGTDRTTFDSVLLQQSATEQSNMTPAESAQRYVRQLWEHALERRRGALPAAATDTETLVERFRLSAEIKRLESVSWENVKSIIRDRIENGMT